MARSGALPGEPLSARGGWEARGERDAPGPGSARVRVCARRGGAGRVHGTGGTRAAVGAGPRCPEGRRGYGARSRPGRRRVPAGDGGKQTDVRGRVRARRPTR